ncbi:MafI family immunity protein [Lonsdalea quercina]|uniref:MafI family immunity protein n=1 Tax=Lonsdalea quercina TaxID=71657 RepID=UPI0039770E1D
MSIGKELNEFGMHFCDRLPEQTLQFALDYIRFGEEPLAFETLCDYLCECDIPLTVQEYREITNFNQILKCPLDRRVIRYLHELVQ